MKWYYEGPITIKNKDTNLKVTMDIYADGTIDNNDFEIHDLKAYHENGDERTLEPWEDSAIEKWLNENDEIYQQALESGADDVYDRYNDR